MVYLFQTDDEIAINDDAQDSSLCLGWLSNEHQAKGDACLAPNMHAADAG